MEKHPREGGGRGGLEAKPPPQIGLILHGSLVQPTPPPPPPLSLLKEHWLPHSLALILQKRKLSKHHNGEAAMKTKPAPSSLKKTSMTESFQMTPLKGTNTKSEWQGAFIPYLFRSNGWDVFVVPESWSGGRRKVEHTFLSCICLWFVWLTGLTKFVLRHFSNMLSNGGAATLWALCVCFLASRTNYRWPACV